MLNLRVSHEILRYDRRMTSYFKQPYLRKLKYNELSVMFKKPIQLHHLHRPEQLIQDIIQDTKMQIVTLVSCSLLTGIVPDVVFFCFMV